MFKQLAYRAFLGVDISLANIYRFFRTEYEGIGTLCEDEIDDLDEQPDKLRMYKSGYTKGIKVPKTEIKNNSEGYEQEGYYTYGFKVFTAEKRPASTRAKGFNERTIELHCTYGLPEYDIAEIANDASDPKNKALLSELNNLRNKLLIYRLIHYYDEIPDVDSNKLDLHAREKQLWKPLLRLFQNSPRTYTALKGVVTDYVNEYRQKKSNTQTAFLVKLISDLIREAKSYTLESSVIWDRYKLELPDGEQLGTTTYKSAQFGDISQKRLISILQDQVKARPP